MSLLQHLSTRRVQPNLRRRPDGETGGDGDPRVAMVAASGQVIDLAPGGQAHPYVEGARGGGAVEISRLQAA